MRLRIVLAVLGCAAFMPSVAGAVPIHVHKKVPVEREVVKHELVKGEPFVTTDTVMATKIVERVRHVPPADEDDDGVADRRDDCIGYCAPPASSYEEPTYTEAAPSYSGGCSYPGVESESGGSYTITNPSSGAYGCYQIIPSTAAAHDCDLSTPTGQDECAARICATSGNGAWAASGATPC